MLVCWRNEPALPMARSISSEKRFPRFNTSANGLVLSVQEQEVIPWVAKRGEMPRGESDLKKNQVKCQHQPPSPSQVHHVPVAN